MANPSLETIRNRVNSLTQQAQALRELSKQAYVPTPPMPQGPPPTDPAAMQGGPPMDPAAMQGQPPMDPAAMQGGPPMDPAAQAPPALDPQLMDQLLSVVEESATKIEQLNATFQQLADRLSAEVSDVAGRLDDLESKVVEMAAVSKAEATAAKNVW